MNEVQVTRDLHGVRSVARRLEDLTDDAVFGAVVLRRRRGVSDRELAFAERRDVAHLRVRHDAELRRAQHGDAKDYVKDADLCLHGSAAESTCFVREINPRVSEELLDDAFVSILCRCFLEKRCNCDV